MPRSMVRRFKVNLDMASPSSESTHPPKSTRLPDVAEQPVGSHLDQERTEAVAALGEGLRELVDGGELAERLGVAELAAYQALHHARCGVVVGGEDVAELGGVGPFADLFDRAVAANR